MKAIYSASDVLLVTHIKNILSTHNIECVIKNDFLNGGAGELPIFDCWPQLFVVNPEQETQASAIIDQVLKQDISYLPSWHCDKCQLEIEGQFDSCWSCGEINKQE